MADEITEKKTDAEGQTPVPSIAPTKRQQSEAITAAEVETEGTAFAQIVGFLKTYWSQVLLVVLVPMVLYQGITYYRTKDLLARQAAYREYELAEEEPNPTRFMDLAEKHSDVPGFQGRSLLRAADLLLRDGLGATFKSSNLSVEERKQRMEQAETLYTRITHLADRTSLQELKARFGLASILETKDNFTDARTAYQEIKKLAGDQWPQQASLAEQRIGELDQLAQKLPFPTKRPKTTLDDLIPDTPDTPGNR
jgi:hypothetical protein